MSIDRRIVSILYYNGITDVNKVEKFLGENGYYYDVVIEGEVKKLKIPGIIYPEDLPTEEYLQEKIEELDENIKKIENDSIFPDSVDSAIESAKNQMFEVNVETYTLSEEKKDSFEEELEKTEIEKKEILEKIEEPEKIEPEKPKKKKTPKLSNKKIKIIESKEIDDDIDDFINTI